MILPPGINKKTFKTALAAWREAIGSDWVMTDDEDLYHYRDAYSPLIGESEEIVTSAALAPASTEEVQQIVRIANQYKIPIYAISTGRNLGYGGAAPNLSGSVAVDLKRMDKIIEVNEKQQFALVEPGVTYFDLYNHIQENNLKVWMDCAEPGWGSLLGNALERGRGYTTAQMRDHFGAHCGMEVVLPNGEVMRTGMGARDNVDTWQGYPYGFGPSMDGLFAQSNFGIVTKMGFWLLPRPEAVFSSTLTVPKYTDIVPLVELLNELENGGIANGLPWITTEILGRLMDPPNRRLQEMIARKGGPSTKELDSFASGKHYWGLRLQFLDPETVAQAKWEYVQQRFRETIPGVKFGDIELYKMPISPEQEQNLSIRGEDVRRVNLGIPNLEIFGMGSRSPITPNPTNGHIWVSPLIPRDGEQVMKAQHVFTRASLDMDVYFGSNVPTPLTMIPRVFLMLLPFFIYQDKKANAKTRDQAERFIDIAADNGWLEYRSHPIFQDKIMNQFNFGDHALRRFTETLKEAVDPNGILSAGRYGIWPERLRKERGGS